MRFLRPLGLVFLTFAANRPLLAAEVDGGIETSFAPQFQSAGTVNQLVGTAGGGWYAVGTFEYYDNQPRPGLARLNPDGSLDLGFIPVSAGATRVELQSSGKLLALVRGPVGKRLVRFTSDGSLDASFAPPVGGAPLTTFAVAPDDRIVVARQAGANAPTTIERWLADGTLDPSFVSGSGTGPGSAVFQLLPAGGGVTYVAGNFSVLNGLGRPSLARLDPAGALDSTFNPTSISFDAPNNPAGKLLASGPNDSIYALVSAPTVIAPAYAGNLVRLLSSGQKDSSFTVDPAEVGIFAAMLPTSDGGLILERVPFPAGARLTKIRANGARDPGYSFNPLGEAEGIALLATSPDGSAFAILTRREFTAGKSTLVRVSAAGGIAGPLGSGAGAESVSGRVSILAKNAAGALLVVGEFQKIDGVPTPGGVARFQPDGTIDPGFRFSGTLASAGPVRAVLLADGSTVLAGRFKLTAGDAYLPACRLDASGAVDPRCFAIFSPFSTGTDVAAGPAGSVFVAGNLQPAGASDFRHVVRLTPAIQLEPGFVAPANPNYLSPSRIAVQPDGKVLVCYNNEALSENILYNGLVRLLSSGAPDPAFDYASHAEARTSVSRVAVAADGRIQVVVSVPATFGSTSDPGTHIVRRILPNGELDPSFRTGVVPELNAVADLEVLPNGGAILLGGFSVVDRRARQQIARLTPNGIVDANFVPGTALGNPPVTTSFLGLVVDSIATTAYPLAVLPDQSLVIAPFSGPALVKLRNGARPAFAGRGKGELINLSTRGRVESGDRAMIAGFVVNGGTQRVVVRALGPSLTAFGVSGALADPTLELVSSAGQSLVTNDDWRGSPNSAAISAAGLEPGDERDAAILVTLSPGAYTAIVRGKNAASGVALVETYLIDGPEFTSPPPAASAPRAINLSTRAFVSTGDAVTIGGFAIRGGWARIVVRALGPSLIPFGVPGVLPNPKVRVIRARDGASIRETDNFGDDPTSGSLSGLNLATPNANEVQTVLDLDEGNYTVIMEGVNGGTGIGLVEIYEIPPGNYPD